MHFSFCGQERPLLCHAALDDYQAVSYAKQKPSGRHCFQFLVTPPAGGPGAGTWENPRGLVTCLPLSGLVRPAKVTYPFSGPSSITWDSAHGDLIHSTSPRDGFPSSLIPSRQAPLAGQVLVQHRGHLSRLCRANRKCARGTEQ